MTQNLSHQGHTGVLLEGEATSPQASLSAAPAGAPPPSNASLAPHYPEGTLKLFILALRVSWNSVPPPPSSHHLLPSPYMKPKSTAAPPSPWGGDHPGKTTLLLMPPNMPFLAVHKPCLYGRPMRC